jgi:hypothetical protein
MSERIENLISKEALAQFEQLGKLTDANVASFEKLIAKGVELNKQLGGATGFKDLNKAATELTENEKALQKQQQELEKQQTKLNQLYSEEAKRIAELKVQQQQRNQQLKDEVQLNQAAEGSIKQKQVQLKQLQKVYDNLSVSQRNASEGDELLKSIQELDKELKGLEGTTGRFQRNVGNYGSALKTLESYLSDVRNQLSATKQASAGFSLGAPGPAIRNNNAPIRTAENKQQLVAYSQTVAQTTQRVEELQKQEQLLSRIVESQMAGFASATAEIKNNEKALQTLAAAGLQSTEFYQVLLKDTAELKDNVGDLKDEIKALASDTRQFDLFAGAVTGLVNALQVGASAAELFAGENQDLQKSIQRLIALQNISQGIQQIANDVTTRGTALNKVYNFIVGEGAKTQKAAAVATAVSTTATDTNTVATEAATVATTGLSTATKVLRAALLASGIALLIAGVIYLVNKLQEWRDADINLIKQQAELNQVTLESIRLTKELADLTRTDFGTSIQGIKNKIAANQAYGRSQGEVLAVEQELLKVQQEAATIKFFDTGGAGRAERLKVELEAAAKALTDFNEAQAAIPEGDRNEKQASAQRALLQSTLDLARENYSEQKKIVDDYYNFNNEASAKQLQIDRLNADERRKAILQSATLSATAIIEANQRVLDNESTNLNQRIALLKGIEEQQKNIAKAQNQNIQNDPGVSAKERALAAQNLGAQLSKIEKDSQQTIAKVREEYRKRDLSANLQMLKTKLEDTAKANDLISDNESKSFNERTDALYAAFESRRSVLVAQYQYEIEAAGLTAKERIAIEKRYASEINNLTIEYGLQQQALYEQNTEKVNDIIEKSLQRRKDIISSNESDAIVALNEQLQAGLITVEEYNRQRGKIEKSARVQQIKEEINDLTGKKITLIAQQKQQSNEFIAIEEAEKKKRKELSDELTNEVIANEQRMTDLKKQLATESIETFNALVNSQFDNESSRIQQQIDELDKQKEKEIEVANATIANKQERETAIARIEARAQAERERLERRQRQIELDRARFEKAANIAQIIGSTAVAIINQLKVTPLPAGGPFVAAIATIGALQLARAIAAPLPKFAEGTDDAPGGLAWVGDAYRKELVVTPQGQVMQTPAVPTVMNVPRHSIVLPDARAALESGLAVNRHGRLVQHESSEIKEVGRKIDTLTKVMRNKPVLNMSATDGGLTAMWNYGANSISYIEDQTRF